MKKYIIGLDAGTTSVRALVYDIVKKEIVCINNQKFTQYFPKPGWVEQDAEEIYDYLIKTIDKSINEVGASLEEYIGFGLTNQRETIVAFDKTTLKPCHKAIVWQCRRTNNYIEKLPKKIVKTIKNKTGLIADAYFSASKIKWILENCNEAKKLLKNNNLCVGTLDSFLCAKLTGNYFTDKTNASRTMIYNINTLEYDNELLKYFNIPKDILPKVVDSSYKFGNIEKYNLPLLSIIGDQQASLLGNGCVDEGTAKCTYGTGGFILLNTGNKPIQSKKLLSTIALSINNKVTYALEGSIFSACSALEWAVKTFNISDDFKEINDKITDLGSNDGVYFVPAFTGLGAPYWLSDAKANLSGVTFNTNAYSVARAIYESMAYNAKAILDEMTHKVISLNELKIDGGGSKCEFLCQFQANMLSCPVVKLPSPEATALGAIYLAGITSKTFAVSDMKKVSKPKQIYNGLLTKTDKDKLYKGWQNAVKKCN